MNVSLNWLKQYIDINGTPDEVSEMLTDLGLEVEGMEHMRCAQCCGGSKSRRRFGGYDS
jgi:phenylalanyl-tRNA synthetase beta chain